MRLSRAAHPLLLLAFYDIPAAAGHQPSKLLRRDLNGDVSNFNNTEYTAVIQIGGQSVNVQLDTGSDDLWFVGGIGEFNDTGVQIQDNYGDGSIFVNGTIGLAEMTIAGQTIPQQAFINVTHSSDLSCDAAVCGLIGLNFGTGISDALSAGGFQGAATVGKSVLSSIFDMNPTNGRFFALAFSRLGDANDTADASLAISEYDPRYSDVQNEPKFPTYPPGNKGWSILGDGVFVDTAAIPWESHTNTIPAGKTRIGFDTGCTNFLLPGKITDAIYSAVPGAVRSNNSSIPTGRWSSDNAVWVIPCSTVINFTTAFENRTYPIHPLDMTEFHTELGPDGQNHTYCVGSASNGGSVTNRTDDNDALFGDSFLRNVYSVFDFGDNTTDPYMRFLALTDANEAAADFARVRQQLLANNPPEISPDALIALFDGPTPSPSAAAPAQRVTGKPNLDLEADASNTDTTSQVAKYAPIVIGLLAANLCLVCVLLVLGVLNFVRGGKTIGASRSRYAPLGTKEDPN
ncbi:aspartic peptidase domain-containing protein [Mycena vitilis]|nr:aspartic peptidase domain-containing protein [Mycena vitilis]